MRKPALALFAAVLTMLAASGAIASGQDEKASWQLEPPKDTQNCPYEVRREWNVEFHPDVAHVMQQLISKAKAYRSPYLPRGLDLSHWTPEIEKLLDSPRLSPYEKLSLFEYCWTGKCWRTPRLHERLILVAKEFQNEELTAEWAVMVGMACLRHAHWEWIEPAQVLADLAIEFFKRAAKLDPDWALPRSCILAAYAKKTYNQSCPNEEDDYDEWKPRLKPSPTAVINEFRKLLDDYWNAPDRSGLVPVPWMIRADDSDQLTWQQKYGYSFVREWYYTETRISQMLWLMTEHAIDRRDGEMLAEILEYATRRYRSPDVYYRSRDVDYLNEMYFQLKYRIWDGSIPELIKEARVTLVYDMPNNRIYEKLRFPETVDQNRPELNDKRDRRAYIVQNFLPLIDKAQQKLKALRPQDFTPIDFRSLTYETARKEQRAARAIYPFSAEASEFKEAIPWNTELTFEAALWVGYLAGSLLSKDPKERSQLNRTWEKTVWSLFEEEGAGYQQRALAELWRGGKSHADEIVEEVEANPEMLEAMSAEWAFTMRRLAGRAVGGMVRSNVEIEAARIRCFELKKKYLRATLEKAPDWAIPRLLLAETELAEAAFDAKALITERRPGVSQIFILIPEEKAQNIANSIKRFLAAQDTRICLPPPWSMRVSRDFVLDVFPDTKQRSELLEVPCEYVGIYNWQGHKAPAAFLAWYGGKCKNTDLIVSAFEYQQRLREIAPNQYADPRNNAYSLKDLVNVICKWLNEGDKREALEAVISEVVQKCTIVGTMHLQKKTRLWLTADETAAANEAYERRSELLAEEVAEATEQARRIVVSLSEEDFRCEAVE